MMSDDKVCLPTDFALSLLENCEFIEQAKDCKNLPHLHKMRRLIADFQRMAICTTFEQAMIAFHGIDIDELQFDTLKVVYESTKPYIMGLTIDACITAITFKHLGKNEFAEAIKTIVEQTKVKEGDGPGKRMKGILVKVSKPES